MELIILQFLLYKYQQLLQPALNFQLPILFQVLLQFPLKFHHYLRIKPQILRHLPIRVQLQDLLLNQAQHLFPLFIKHQL